MREMAVSSSGTNGSHALRNRIARAVFGAADSLGISNRALVEQLTEQVIERLEQTYKSFPGMEGAIPEFRLRQAEIQATIKQILAEGSDMELAMHPTEQKREVKRSEPSKISPPKRVKGTKEGPITLSENALRVLERRYLKTDDKGCTIETPGDMLRRVARNIASAELLYDPQTDAAAWEETFYRIMADLEFLPNSPTLMNAGRDLQQLSACFVLPIDDSMGNIFDAIKHTALIHKSGGGTGFSFSRLRPQGDTVGSTGKVASGPVSFMRAFDAATDVIKQGGMRRGANMAILNIDHPDIMRFITAKEKGDALTNFNLSVAATDDFMHAVDEEADFNLINPRDKSIYDSLNAKEVYDEIVDLAWRTGDPGIVFIDRINRGNPTPKLGAIESTNPCGEQPLLPYESCNLGSVNLAMMVSQGENGKPSIDYARLGETVKVAIRFLDNVIDMNSFPLPEIEDMTKKTRKIGLGVMGFADMLIKLGIPYNSEGALNVGEEVMRFVDRTATEASVALSDERGTFPAFAESVYAEGGPRVRNATRTTIAPTGTLSIIAGCSSGIEPLFALSYMRNILDNDELIEVNPYFEEVARSEGFYSPELMKELAVKGSLHEIEDVPDWVKRTFVTAHDISPEWHIRMQAAFQRSTDNAVSKTINFPNSATKEDVAQAYILAYKEGCKGITIYRDRSKDKQVLNIAGEGEGDGDNEDSAIFTPRSPRKRARTTSGVTERVTTGCGSIYVTVNSDEHGICEVFSSLGKAGGCASAQLEAISRLISLALRSGVDVPAVVKHIRGIRCPAIAWDQGHSVLSCPDAIASVLERQLSGGDVEIPKPSGVAMKLGGHCPECGGMLVYQEGCHICPACGYTKCS